MARGSSTGPPAVTTGTTRYRIALDHHYKGTRRFSLHSLRATFASTLARNGVNPFCIQRLMGHADLQTTMHYCSVNEDEMLRAVEGIG
jgi:site-specific recombinase XerD